MIFKRGNTIKKNTVKRSEYFKRNTFSRFLGIYILSTVFCLSVLGIMASQKILSQQKESNKKTALDFVSVLENQLLNNYYYANSILMELLEDTNLQKEILYYLNNDISDYWGFHLDLFIPSSGNVTPSIDSWLSQLLFRSANLNKVIMYSYEKRTIIRAEGNNTIYKDLGMYGFTESYKEIESILDSDRVNIQPYLYRGDNRELMLVLTVPVKDTATFIKQGDILLFFALPDSPVENSIADIGAEIYLSTGHTSYLCYPSDPELIRELPANSRALVESKMFNNRLNLRLYLQPASRGIPPSVSFIIIVTVILVSASIFGAYLFLRRFFARIQIITQAMEDARGGDLNVRIPIKEDEDELAVIGSGFNQMCFDLQEYIAKSYIATLNQKSAELISLQNQIQPHFLYNTLEAIRMKAISGGCEDIGKMIYHLGALFRHQLNNSMEISLGKELDFCFSYLELYRARYKEGFVIQNKISPEIHSFQILKLSLQPLVENYMIHGYDPERKDNYICFDYERKVGFVTIHLIDNGKGLSLEREKKINNALSEDCDSFEDSIGLINVHHRLKKAFGPDAGITIKRRKERGAIVSLSLPEQENINVQFINH